MARSFSISKSGKTQFVFFPNIKIFSKYREINKLSYYMYKLIIYDFVYRDFSLRINYYSMYYTNTNIFFFFKFFLAKYIYYLEKFWNIFIIILSLFNLKNNTYIINVTQMDVLMTGQWSLLTALFVIYLSQHQLMLNKNEFMDCVLCVFWLIVRFHSV